MKPYSKLLLCTAICGLSYAHPLQAAPTAAAVLRTMAQASKSLSYTATETVVRPGAPQVQLKIQRSERKRRFDYLAPDVRRGDAVIDNGSTVWVYLRGENAAVQTLSRPSREFALRPDMKAWVTGAATVDKRPTWIVEVSRGESQRRLWIDQKTGALLRREIRSGGAIVEASALSGIHYGKIPASAFSWTPPPGTKQTRSGGTLFVSASAARRVAMLKFPSWIPGGYSFESAIVDEKKGEAWLRFSGAKRFSIFQSRAEHETPLQQVEGAWFLARGGKRFVIVGLDEADARKLAGGL